MTSIDTSFEDDELNLTLSQSSNASCCESDNFELSQDSGIQGSTLPDGMPLQYGSVIQRWRLVRKLGRQDNVRQWQSVMLLP